MRLRWATHFGSLARTHCAAVLISPMRCRRILKRNGKLTTMNVTQIAREAADANLAVRKRVNWW